MAAEKALDNPNCRERKDGALKKGFPPGLSGSIRNRGDYNYREQANENSLPDQFSGPVQKTVFRRRVTNYLKIPFCRCLLFQFYGRSFLNTAMQMTFA